MLQSCRVKGVAEVNSWGGYAKQYQVRLDPDKLIKYGLTFDEVVKKVKDENNFNVGGGAIRENTQTLIVHGQARATSAAEVAAIVLAAQDGTPVKGGAVAEAVVGHEIRRGAVPRDGQAQRGAGARGRRLGVVRDGAIEVRKPTLLGELIIMIVYLPILTLEGVEGKLFRPMALTVIFALAGSMVLSLTLMPVLASLVLFDRAGAKRSFVSTLLNGAAVVVVRVTIPAACG